MMIMMIIHSPQINTINNNAINNYSLNKSEDPAPVNQDFLSRTVYGNNNNNNSNPWGQ